jgi:glycosyltransferase involved in cell wall biosynthesis
VGVICSRDGYEHPHARLPALERYNGVDIHRVVQPRFGRARILGRAVDYLSMYVGFAAALAMRARPGDIVVGKTDPPMLGAAIAPVARLRGLTQVNWLQDLYPEVALGLGLNALKPLAPLLFALRDWSLAGAYNVTVGEGMAERVARRRISRDRIACIPNWCDEIRLAGADEAAQALRAQWGLRGKFVLGYCGNLGRAHEIETLLGAAERLRDREDIAFLFVGGGHLTPKLQAEVHRRGLGSAFRFEPYQPCERVAATLSAADAHWISLRPEMEGLIVPSKFYAAAAAGRPIIAAVDESGELARLVRRHDCGTVAPPGDVSAFATAVRTLSDDPARRERQGRNARAMIENEFPRERALDAWVRRLEQVARAGVPAPSAERDALAAGPVLQRESV